MYQLELDGTGVVDRGVAALEVVEAVDVVADRQGGTGAALEVVDSFELALERREEALGDGIDAPMFVKLLLGPTASRRPPTGAFVES